MRQWQVGEILILLGDLQFLHRLAAGIGKGPGRKHHALGLPSGAGGVENAEQSIGRLLVDFGKRCVRGQQCMPAMFSLKRWVWHGDAHHVSGDARLQFGRLIQLAKEDHLALRVAQHVVDALGRL